jgi:uncharacterized protein with NRDE domain
MCLIAFRYDAHPEYRLIFAGNRDEFYSRPTTPVHFWDDAPHVLAGRDDQAGGTWLGVARDGRWATVTNYRDPDTHMPDAPSRGHLVSDFLTGSQGPRAYLRSVASRANQYNGFNLLAGDPRTCAYLSNRDGGVRTVSPGTHGLSNHLLNTSWPKVDRGKQKLDAVVEDGVSVRRLLALLDDREQADPAQLPDTGVGPEAEAMLSPIFIQSEEYGTRSSTVLLIDRDGRVTFAERTYERGVAVRTREFSFEAVPATGTTGRE